MNVQTIFGHKVIKIQCEDKDIYKNKLLTDSVNMVFKSPVVINRVRQTIGDSHKGGGMTSVGQPYPLIDLPGASKMKEWLTEQFLSVKDELGHSHKGNSVKFKRSWANRMAKGAYGDVHQHVKIDNYMSNLTGYSQEGFCPDAVGILYVNVPPDSSNLVLVKDGREDTPVEMFPKEDTVWLQPNEGLLIIHSPYVWHGVSTHESDLPRDVFVFDIDFE
jgi:hypothetical protein